MTISTETHVGAEWPLSQGFPRPSRTWSRSGGRSEGRESPCRGGPLARAPLTAPPDRRLACFLQRREVCPAPRGGLARPPGTGWDSCLRRGPPARARVRAREASSAGEACRTHGAALRLQTANTGPGASRSEGRNGREGRSWRWAKTHATRQKAAAWYVTHGQRGEGGQASAFLLSSGKRSHQRKAAAQPAFPAVIKERVFS